MEPMGHRTQAPVTLRADTSPERVAIVTMRDCYRIGHYCVTLDSIISFFYFLWSKNPFLLLFMQHSFVLSLY